MEYVQEGLDIEMKNKYNKNILNNSYLKYCKLHKERNSQEPICTVLNVQKV